MQNKIIRQYLFLSALFSVGGLSIISAMYVTYLMSHGLSLFETNAVNAIYFFTLFICEIPTGAFADIFGRKKSFIVACLLMGASMFIYGAVTTFTGFVIAEIVGAVGSTFKSGAFRAWLVDRLKHHGFEGELSKVFAKENLVRQIAGGIGAIFGSYIAVVNMSLPWFIGGTTLLITAVFAMVMMKEEYFVPIKLSFKQGLISMKTVTVSSFHFARRDRAVRFVLIITGLQVFAFQALNMYWQPFFKSYGVAEKHFGFVFTTMMAGVALGAFIISRMNTAGREKQVIIITQILTGLAVLSTISLSGIGFVISAFVLHEMFRGAFDPLLGSFLHKRIPSSERATIDSFCSIAPHIAGSIGLLASGAIAEMFGIRFAWLISGLILIIGAIAVRNGHKNKDPVPDS